MVNLEIRTHPNVIFAYTPNHVEMILRVENNHHTCWAEADVHVPERLSLSPDKDNNLRKGRVRVGIVENNQYLEKAVRIYSNTYTNPQMYRCKITLYVYNKDGVIESRLEKPIDIRCELKKNAVL